MFEQFRNPPSEYRLAPFWAWNETPDPIEIDRQVREMYSKGIGGFFIDGRMAKSGDGSSDELIQRTQRACEAAERLGLHVYQYENQRGDRRIPPALATKLRTSAAHSSGRARAAARVFGSHGWSLSMSEMKRVVDRQACLGVSFICPESFHYSIAGLPKRGGSVSQFYQATYWPHYKHFADYAARLSYVLAQGTHRPQAALLRPGAYGDPLDRDAAEWLQAYCECLLAEHVDFDILDERTLTDATCEDEHLSLGAERYEMLILPPLGSVALKAAEKIQAFVDDGGKLIGTMLLPAEDSSGDRHAEVREAFAGVFGQQSDGARVCFLDIKRCSDLPPALRPVLDATLKRAVSVRRNGEECPDIACIQRATDEADVFFLANYADEAREVRISFRSDGAPHMLNLETGSCTALPNCTQQGNRTVLLYRFEAHGSLMVAFGHEPALAVASPIVDDGQEIAFPKEWEFVPEQLNCLCLPEWTFNTLIQGDREAYEYTTSFEADFVPDDLVLALEQTNGFRPSDGLTVFINDAKAPPLGSWITDTGIRTIDVSALVREGLNVIRMTVEREGWTGEPQPVPAGPRLMGSFSVSDSRSLQPPREFIHDGSWTDQGYPYYSGTAAYKQTVFIPHFARGQRIILRVENPADAVEFVVNGTVAGLRPWAPFDVDITPLVKPGANHIELRVTNSLANMLLGEARPSGLLGGAVALLA